MIGTSKISQNALHACNCMLTHLLRTNGFTGVNAYSRMARVKQAIVATKDVNNQTGIGKELYYAVHVSFKSRGSTNMHSINTLSDLQL